MPPEAREAGERRLPGGEGVALDLHVQEPLGDDGRGRAPQQHEAGLGGDVGPEHELARGHADARGDHPRTDQGPVGRRRGRELPGFQGRQLVVGHQRVILADVESAHHGERADGHRRRGRGRPGRAAPAHRRDRRATTATSPRSRSSTTAPPGAGSTSRSTCPARRPPWPTSCGRSRWCAGVELVKTFQAHLRQAHHHHGRRGAGRPGGDRRDLRGRPPQHPRRAHLGGHHPAGGRAPAGGRGARGGPPAPRARAGAGRRADGRRHREGGARGAGAGAARDQPEHGGQRARRRGPGGDATPCRPG